MKSYYCAFEAIKAFDLILYLVIYYTDAIRETIINFCEKPFEYMAVQMLAKMLATVRRMSLYTDRRTFEIRGCYCSAREHGKRQ